MASKPIPWESLPVPHLREISIEGLFGLYDHTVELHQDPPLTIVAGPNGIGKTTLLRLCTALLGAAYRELTRQQFTRLCVRSADGTRLEAMPLDPHDAESESVRLQLRQSK